MKKYIDILNAPAKVQFLRVAAMCKTPVGSKIYNEAIEEHPEYFPEEVEYRRKQALIPESVREAHSKGWAEIVSALNKEFPKGQGISWAIENHEEWSRINDERKKKELPLMKALHEKHYSKYGIEWNGW
jgi:hypothetical protein